MQRISSILILLMMFSFAIQAQVNEVPVGSNPTLQKEAAEEDQRIQTMLNKLESDRLSAMNFAEDTIFAIGTCLMPGDSFELCIDTSGISNALTTLSICNMPSLGTIVEVPDTTCFIYYSDPTPVTDMVFDTMCYEFCNLGTCDTTIYPFIIHRDNNTSTLPNNVMNTEDQITVCVPSGDLPGDFTSSQVLSGANTPIGSVYSAADCIIFESQLFAGTDTIDFEVCDNFCVCDTYRIPITVIGDTIDIPFMDDFSYAGPRPNKELWLDRRVFINNDMAMNPVSIGVATFDGLNQRGAPNGGGYGVSDVMTSAYLDLSNFTGNSNVYLSFYIQPKGLGEVPDGADSLVLEFKDVNNNWTEIDSYTGDDPSIPTDDFSFFSYKVNLSQYFFKGFQFRFKNFSKKTGNIDHWHLDYVRLLSNSNDSPVFPDVAFTQVPKLLLKNYSSMPWWHFEGFENDEVQDQSIYSEANLYNHFDQTLEIVPSQGEHTTDEATNMVNLVTSQLFDGNQSNIVVGNNNVTSALISNSFNATKSALESSFPGAMSLEFTRTFYFDKLSEEPSGLSSPVDNNTVTSSTIFDNYFAYGDNTAESGLEGSKKDVQLALKFHANVADTLKAIQMHFPHIVANTSTQSFNLRVWIGQLDDTPEYDGLFQKPLYIDSYLDSLNGFTTYLLIDASTGERKPLAIPAGDFYVGWQQVSDCAIFNCISVGLDKNRPEGMSDVYFDGLGIGVWENVAAANPALTGSLMIRPVVGPGEPMPSSNIDELTQTNFSIFPNPTTGLINIEIENNDFQDFNFRIFNTVGQMLLQNKLTSQINLSDLESGIYFIQINHQDSNQVFNKKIIITK